MGFWSLRHLQLFHRQRRAGTLDFNRISHEGLWTVLKSNFFPSFTGFRSMLHRQRIHETGQSSSTSCTRHHDKITFYRTKYFKPHPSELATATSHSSPRSHDTSFTHPSSLSRLPHASLPRVSHSSSTTYHHFHIQSESLSSRLDHTKTSSPSCLDHSKTFSSFYLDHSTTDAGGSDRSSLHSDNRQRNR